MWNDNIKKKENQINIDSCLCVFFSSALTSAIADAGLLMLHIHCP